MSQDPQRPFRSQPDSNKARGAGYNPHNRFDSYHRDPSSEIDISPDEDLESPDRTTYIEDRTQTIITYNDSPDVGFDAGINVYRGCEHGCIYCYARPTHEFLGFSSGLDFEQKIIVKAKAPTLLRRELEARKWKPQVLAMSGVTDPYQPIERKLQLTRKCLRVLADFRNPVGIITKNQLLTRDLDLLRELNEFGAIAVYISLTSLDPQLRKIMEPRTSPPQARLHTIEQLAANGIPAGTLLAPIIPGLNDHEIPKIIEAAKNAGANFAGRVILRLPLQVKNLLTNWLERHFPDRKAKVLNHLRATRDGSLNSSEFGKRMQGEGLYAQQIHQLFKVACKQAGLANKAPTLSTKHFRSNPNQLDLFAS